MFVFVGYLQFQICMALLMHGFCHLKGMNLLFSTLYDENNNIVTSWKIRTFVGIRTEPWPVRIVNIRKWSI